MTTQFNREQWLTEAATLICSELLDQEANRYGLTTPPFKISVGWPHANKGKHRTIGGQCFARHMSTAGQNEIFISPTLDDSKQVLLVLIHELCHAYDDCQSGHKGNFATLARSAGFVPPLTSARDGNTTPQLNSYVEDLTNLLGPIPHAKLDTSVIPKGSSRQLKMYCTNQGCDFKFRASQTMINKMNYNTCLICGTETLTQEQK